MFAEPFVEAEFTDLELGTEREVTAADRARERKNLSGCRPTLGSHGEDEEGAGGGDGESAPVSKRRDGGGAPVSKRRKTAPTSQTGSGKELRKRKAADKTLRAQSSGKSRAKETDTTDCMPTSSFKPSLRPTLLALPWSTMEKIYTVGETESEFGVRDIPCRDELDRHLRALARRNQIPSMYHLYLVSDWWRTKLRVNKGMKKLKQQDWGHLMHKATCQDMSLPAGVRDDHCAIQEVEGLVFAPGVDDGHASDVDEGHNASREEGTAYRAVWSI